MSRRLAPAVIAAMVAGGLALPAAALGAAPGADRAGVPTRADSTVTIRTENGDFWGRVDSPKPAKCAKNRTVTVYRQKGPSPAPQTDKEIASDTAGKVGDHYEWNTGNTGATNGRYYAHIRRTPSCQPDLSPTVRVIRDS